MPSGLRTSPGRRLVRRLRLTGLCNPLLLFSCLDSLRMPRGANLSDRDLMRLPEIDQESGRRPCRRAQCLLGSG